MLLLTCFVTTRAFSRRLPKWLEHAVIYQIYPASFQDSNGDGIGDLKGIISRLDYINQIGCNTIWLNPCFSSDFHDGGYDVIDYYRIAPRYGSNDDMRHLIKETHRRNMKIILDLVAGHTSTSCPWFKYSQKKEVNAYSKRYIWTDDFSVCPPKFVKDTTTERQGCYMKNYFDFQPALNYGYGQPDAGYSWEEPLSAPGPTATRLELMRIMDFWMDMGCDGFRIDMAGSLVKNDPDLKGTKLLWNEVRTHFQNRYPEGVLIAEWGYPDKAKEIGFMADFLFQYGRGGYRELFFNETGVYRRDTCYFDRQGLGSPDRFIESLLNSIKAMGNDALLSVPTGNHDIQRLNCGTRSDDDDIKTALTFILTMPSIPCIYYGDEIGMRYMEGLPDKEGSVNKAGNRAGSRTPMQWDCSPKGGFSTAESTLFYLPLNSDHYTRNAALQLCDSSSILNHVKWLLSLRRKHKALSTKGKIRFLPNLNGNKYPLRYIREHARERVLITINPISPQTTNIKFL